MSVLKDIFFGATLVVLTIFCAQGVADGNMMVWKDAVRGHQKATEALLIETNTKSNRLIVAHCEGVATFSLQTCQTQLEFSASHLSDYLQQMILPEDQIRRMGAAVVVVLASIRSPILAFSRSGTTGFETAAGQLVQSLMSSKIYQVAFAKPVEADEYRLLQNGDLDWHLIGDTAVLFRLFEQINQSMGENPDKALAYESELAWTE